MYICIATEKLIETILFVSFLPIIKNNK